MMQKIILITGGTGFLGSHLVHHLLESTYQVIMLKRSTSNTWRINDVIRDIKFYDVDIHGIAKAFEEQHIDIVIHTACCYGRNNEKTSFIVDTNIMFGLRLFEYAEKYNLYYMSENIFITDGTGFLGSGTPTAQFL
jgi:nucleoside-diphosphate-sugar epimerase